MAVDALVSFTAKITTSKKNKPLMTGSGFFYENNSKLFYVTNRHVIIKESENYDSDEISLLLHLDKNNLERNDELKIPLYDGKKPIWLEHPTSGSKVDIVAIPLNKDEVKKKYFINAFSLNRHIPSEIDVPLGQDVSILGFPKGFYDAKYNLPIIRNGILANPYPVPFGGNPYYLIDAKLRQGSSGSPVVTKPMNFVQTKTGASQLRFGGNTRYLVGIYSAEIDLLGTDDTDPLGLGIVWFASLIQEITN